MYTDLPAGKLLAVTRRRSCGRRGSSTALYLVGPPKHVALDASISARNVVASRLRRNALDRCSPASSRKYARVWPSGLADKAPQAPRPAAEAVSVPSSHAWNRFRGTSQRRPTRVAGMEPLRTHS